MRIGPTSKRRIEMMTLEQLTDLFKWMTIINIGLLVLSSVLVMVLKNIMYKMHGKLFGIKEDKVAIVSYGYLGMLKVLVIVFNIVPYISLLLIQ
jgi:hypothetical protein